MKSIEEIRKETPLSVTTTDNAIYEVLEDVEPLIYDVHVLENGQRMGYCTQKRVQLKAGTRLRLLQCDDNEADNHYRYGDKNQKVIIPDSVMKYISGNLGPQF